MPSIRIGTTLPRATAPTMPHMPSLPFLRPFPVVARDLRFLVQRQRRTGHILPYRSPGADRRATSDGHRRDELGIGADLHVILDHRTVLVYTVVIAGDRSGSDVDVSADGGFADIRQMIE